MDKIFFENYKSFKKLQELELKPITILLGKNSSGKSSIAKLPCMIEHSLLGEFPEPLQLVNDEVELGAEFRDLMHGRVTTGASSLKIGLLSDSESLDLSIVHGNQVNDKFDVFEWEHVKNNVKKTVNDSANFNGFLLSDDEYIDDEEKVSLSLNCDYIGPFRELPQRSYSSYLTKNKSKFGIHGENAYPLLIQDVFSENQEVINSVSNWYEEHFDGWSLRVNSEKSPFYQLELGRKDKGTYVNIKDVGQGMSQALPIITRAFLPVKKETLIILEQPELHLHPGAHGELGELFVSSVNLDKNKKYLIETHSQNLLLRIRSLVAIGKIKPEDVKIYYVEFNDESNESNLVPIDLDNKGDVSYWPDEIFNESFYEARRLAKAQKET